MSVVIFSESNLGGLVARCATFAMIA